MKEALTCRGCGASFTHHRRKKYCSPDCRGRHVHKCKNCKASFRSSKKVQHYCGRDCYESFVGRGLSACSHCGRNYTPKASDRTTYCSRDCAYAYRANRSKLVGELRAHRRMAARRKTCVHCDVFFIGSQAKAYCSDECAREAQRVRSLARLEDDYVAPSYKCRECGVVFNPEYRDKRRVYCSKTCAKRAGRRTMKARRRARKRGSVADPINPYDIFDRDKWRCQLCGVATPRRLRGSHDERAPELDHVIPLSLGGSHTYGNVQCACRRCNNAKAASIAGQLDLIESMWRVSLSKVQDTPQRDRTGRQTFTPSKLEGGAFHRGRDG